jgi:hypothetical protein
MNKRALVYLGLASATLAIAYLYIQNIQSQPKQAQSASSEPAAQALESLSIVDGSLTTGKYRASLQKGQKVQFLVHSNQTDSLIIEGLDVRVPLPAGQTTLVTIEGRTPGEHAIELDLSGTSIGSITVMQ